MYRILMPVDTKEDRAKSQVAYVRALPAETDTIEVLLLHVFTEEEGQGLPRDAGTKEASRVGAVRRAKESLEDAGIEVSVFDESGDPAKCIVTEAEANDVDEIVIGSKKRSPAGKAVFGSVAQSVIIDSERPVTVVDPGWS